MEHPLTDNWFVLRDLTRPNAKRPAYRLLEEKGIEVSTPMRWQLVERKGKRIREEVPLLHDLLFAHTTCACMDPIVEEISTLQYRYLRGGYRKPMTVGHAEMNRFIRAVHSDDSPRYFLVEELTPAMYGRMIRIEGGPLDGYEGRLLSIRGARVKRLIVEIPGLLVAAVEVDPEYIRLGNYILLYTITKIIKGHITMYPFIIQSFFSFFFPFPSFLTLQERVFRKRGSRGSIFGL